MAGTTTLTTRVPLKNPLGQMVGEKLVVNWTADSSAATVPALSVDLKGFIQRIVTNPGSTAPTANYDIYLYDTDNDSALDVLAGACADRSAATTEQVAPVMSGATFPVYLNGTYSLEVKNNAVNSATGAITLYVLFP